MAMSMSPTPIPTNFDTDARFMLPTRTIAVLCRAEDRGKLGDGTIRTYFVHSLMELIGRVATDQQPLVLLHAAAVSDADLETASILRDLPCGAVIAVLAEENNPVPALQLARKMQLGWVLPEVCIRFPRQLHRWADWIEAGGPRPGVAAHLAEGSEVHKRLVRTRADKPRVIEAALEFVKNFRKEPTFIFDLRLMLEEAINNSIYHAFQDTAGKEKYRIETFKSLAEGETVEVEFGADDTTLALAISDNQGQLLRDHIMNKIERHLSARGLLDQNGRGLYLIYSLAGRAIFNVYPRKMSQIVILQPVHETAWLEAPMKPLLIFTHT